MNTTTLNLLLLAGLSSGTKFNREHFDSNWQLIDNAVGAMQSTIKTLEEGLNFKFSDDDYREIASLITLSAEQLAHLKGDDYSITSADYEEIASLVKLTAEELKSIASSVELSAEDKENIATLLTLTDDHLEIIAQNVSLTSTQLQSMVDLLTLTDTELSTIASKVTLTDSQILTIAQSIQLTTAQVQSIADSIVFTSTQLDSIADLVTLTTSQLETIADGVSFSQAQLENMANSIVLTAANLSAVAENVTFTDTQLERIAELIPWTDDLVALVKGPKGDTGDMPTITIGTVSTLVYTAEVSVEIDPSSTAENVILNIGIPVGVPWDAPLEAIEVPYSGTLNTGHTNTVVKSPNGYVWGNFGITTSFSCASGSVTGLFTLPEGFRPSSAVTTVVRNSTNSLILNISALGLVGVIPASTLSSGASVIGSFDFYTEGSI